MNIPEYVYTSKCPGKIRLRGSNTPVASHDINKLLTKDQIKAAEKRGWIKLRKTKEEKKDNG